MKPLIQFISLFLALFYAQITFSQDHPIKPNAYGQIGEIDLTKKIDTSVGSADAPLLFTIGIHIEPHGLNDAKKENTDKQKKGRPKPDYHNPKFFERDLENIKKLITIVEKHGGKVVVQAQSPFIDMLESNHNNLLSDLAKHEHEIALHFHEINHMGPEGNYMPPNKWVEVMKKQIALIEKLSGTKINYWSGGNLYPHILEAASQSGLSVMSDFKNPHTQKSDPLLMAINPWRPAGGPSESDITAFAKNDPQGKIIYLPDGIFPDTGMFGKERAANGASAYFDSLTEALETSLKACRKDRVNVLHITVHPGEFRGGPQGNFEIIDQWLTQVVDPMVKSGKIKWSTYSQMAEQFREWEKNNPGVDPRVTAPPATTTSSPSGKKGYITFAVNVHDIKNVDKSAQTLLHFLSIFEKYKVRGDFYFTEPIAHLLAQKHPEVIEKLKNSNMTISYHVRPPHPLYEGFDSRLEGLSDEELKKMALDYETYQLDMKTGELNRNEPGGYSYVKQLFGRAPVALGTPNPDIRIRKIFLETYKSMGAKIVITYHEEGTKIDKPFEWKEGLLIRPSDFSITRWNTTSGEAKGKKDAFWWNMLDTPVANQFDPIKKLKEKLSAWSATRPPFITVLIHEDNLYAKGGTPWNNIYFLNGDKSSPLKPPYDLNAPDASKPRTEDNQKIIWAKYEELVKYASENLEVVTSEDIVKMAEQNK